MSRNPLGGNVSVDVLSHDYLGCRDVRLRALLTMSCSMLSSGEMAADISKGAPRAPANEVCSGPECVNEQLVVKEQSFFQSIIARYIHDPWFMDLNNVSQLIF